MTTQPEALRLAAVPIFDRSITWQSQATIELRRLSAENERLHQINQSHEMKLSVRGYEIQIADLVAQRDALLEFAKYVEAIDPGNPAPLFERARAAIKAVEGENP